jgi:hypothetical protein
MLNLSEIVSSLKMEESLDKAGLRLHWKEQSHSQKSPSCATLPDKTLPESPVSKPTEKL